MRKRARTKKRRKKIKRRKETNQKMRFYRRTSAEIQAIAEY